MNNSIEFAGIECKTNCPFCGGTLIVNGPVKHTVCKSCQSSVELSDTFWYHVFEDMPKSIRQLKPNEVTPKQVWTASFQLHMRYGRLTPACPSCKTIYDNLHGHISERHTSVSCSKCGKQGSVSYPQSWLTSIAPGIQVLINAETSEPGEEPAPSAAKPVIFTCPACSGALKVDGTQRTVDCTFCNSSVYLPDDLWLRMHPVKTVQYWYAGFRV